MTLLYKTISYPFLVANQSERLVFEGCDRVQGSAFSNHCHLNLCDSVMPLGSTELCASRPLVSRSLEAPIDIVSRDPGVQSMWVVHGFQWACITENILIQPHQLPSGRNRLPRTISLPLCPDSPSGMFDSCNLAQIHSSFCQHLS